MVTGMGFNSATLKTADTVDGMMDGTSVNGEITGSASELLKHGAGETTDCPFINLEKLQMFVCNMCVYQPLIY